MGALTWKLHGEVRAEERAPDGELQEGELREEDGRAQGASMAATWASAREKHRALELEEKGREHAGRNAGEGVAVR
jgi:hypothetical protein